MKKILAILLLFLSLATATWWDYDWTHKVPCYINTSVPSSLSNFPAHCILDTVTLISSGKMLSDCSDIRLINQYDNDSLNFEIEAGTCNTTKTVIWVGIPSTNATGNNTAYIYYGNAGASDSQNATGLWQDALYTGVWHMGENTTLIDSVGYNNLTAGGTFCNLTTNYSRWGYGTYFMFNCYYTKTSGIFGMPTGTSNSSIEIYAYTINQSVSTNGGYFAVGALGVGQLRLAYLIGTKQMQMEKYGGAITSSNSVDNATDYLYASNWINGGGQIWYYNSTNEVNTNGSLALNTGTGYLTIGSNPDTSYSAKLNQTIITEVRISNATRTNLWFNALYSQTDTIGTEESQGNLSVNLISPLNQTNFYDDTVTLEYEVITSSNTNCSLWIGKPLLMALYSVNSTNTTATIYNEYTFPLGLGSYEWYVSCTNGVITEDTDKWILRYDFNVTQLSPVDGSRLLNSTNVNLTYEVYMPSGESIATRLYLDGVNIYNDTSASSENITYFYNTTYGNHSWYVFAYDTADITVNETTGTDTFEVYFDVNLSSPDNNGLPIVGDSIPLIYNTTNYEPITCNLTLDNITINTTNISLSDSITIITNTTNDTHTWFVNCSANDNSNYTVSSTVWTFAFNVATLLSEVNLTNLSDYVVTAPQRIFYDVNGNLNVLYTTEIYGIQYLNIKTIENETVTTTYKTQLNYTLDYFIVLRETNITRLLTWNKDNTTVYFITLNGTDITINQSSSNYLARTNTWFDPYAYANTKHLETLTYTNNSYYLFILPTNITGVGNNSTQLVRLNVSSNTLVNITSNSGGAFIGQTLANRSDLTQWYYLFPDYINATYSRPAIFYYNGTNTYGLKIFNNSDERINNTDLPNVISRLEHYGNRTYALFSNFAYTGEKTVIHYIEGNITYNSSNNMEDPSDFYFIDENTFVIFSEEDGDTYAYSCYFGSSANCTRFSSSDYGAEVPYYSGDLTTSKRENERDVVTTGYILTSDIVKLSYSEYTYDTKFICYDEMDEFRLPFTVQIYTPTTSNILKSNSWGYVLPSSLFGDGTKRAYSFCVNGTQRLFIVGLTSNFSLDFYSLNNNSGQYYTFYVWDEFNQPVENARITAYRYSPTKGAWVVIEQALTDFSGAGTLFLEQYILYNIIIEAEGYVVLDLDFLPSSVTTLNINLNQEGVGIQKLQDYEYMFDDVSYSLLPTDTYHPTNINISYTVSSNASKLQYYGINITRIYNTTTTEVYFQNITTQPSGGMLEFETNGTGKYEVKIWFKHENYTEYSPMTKVYYVNYSGGLAEAREELIAEEPISGWAYFFIALIITMCVAGFVSQYSFEGAGLMGLLTLWIFALFYPDASIVCIGGESGMCLTVFWATIFTSIGTLSVMALRQYI